MTGNPIRRDHAEVPACPLDEVDDVAVRYYDATQRRRSRREHDRRRIVALDASLQARGRLTPHIAECESRGDSRSAGNGDTQPADRNRRAQLFERGHDSTAGEQIRALAALDDLPEPLDGRGWIERH